MCRVACTLLRLRMCSANGLMRIRSHSRLSRKTLQLVMQSETLRWRRSSIFRTCSARRDASLNVRSAVSKQIFLSDGTWSERKRTLLPNERTVPRERRCVVASLRCACSLKGFGTKALRDPTYSTCCVCMCADACQCWSGCTSCEVPRRLAAPQPFAGMNAIGDPGGERMDSACAVLWGRRASGFREPRRESSRSNSRFVSGPSHSQRDANVTSAWVENWTRNLDATRGYCFYGTSPLPLFPVGGRTWFGLGFRARWSNKFGPPVGDGAVTQWEIADCEVEEQSVGVGQWQLVLDHKVGRELNWAILQRKSFGW